MATAEATFWTFASIGIIAIAVSIVYWFSQVLISSISAFKDYNRFKFEKGVIKVKKRTFLVPKLFMGIWLLTIVFLGFNWKTVLVLLAMYLFTPVLVKGKNLVSTGIVIALLLIGGFFGFKGIAKLGDRFYKEKGKRGDWV